MFQGLLNNLNLLGGGNGGGADDAYVASVPPPESAAPELTATEKTIARLRLRQLKASEGRDAGQRTGAGEATQVTLGDEAAVPTVALKYDPTCSQPTPSEDTEEDEHAASIPQDIRNNPHATRWTCGRRTVVSGDVKAETGGVLLRQ